MKGSRILIGLIVCTALLSITPRPSCAVPTGVDLVFYEQGPIYWGNIDPNGTDIIIGVSSMSIIKTSDGTVLGTYPVTGGQLEFSATWVPGSYATFGNGSFSQRLGTIAAGGSIQFLSGTVNGMSLPGAVSAMFSGASGSFSLTASNSVLIAVTGGGPIINGTLSDTFASLFYLDNMVKGSGALSFDYWNDTLQSGTVSLQFLQNVPVPIPSALVLLGTALLGLFGIRKKIRQ